MKQVEVIGSRSRSWPIREAKDQTRLIKSAITAKPADVGSAPPPSNNEAEESSRPVTPGKRRIKDPYAAESLTDLLSPSKDDRTKPVRAPRSAASAKPPPRDYEELFVSQVDEPDATPSKPTRGPVAPKVGAGKNFQPNRIFGEDDEESHSQIAYKANPKRFEHFEIGGDNGDLEVEEKPAANRKSRQMPQWELNDSFVPEKPRRGLRGQEVSHLPWDDIVPEPTPPPRPHVAHPRRDAETHFELKDPEEQPQSGRIISSFQNKGLHLYRDPVFDMGDSPVKNKNLNTLGSKPTSRKKDFESHWDMTDSPQAHNNFNDENQKPVGQDRMKSVKMMESSWDRYDQSPQRSSVAAPPNGVRNAYHRSWDFGNE